MLNTLIIVTIEQLTIIFDEQRVFHIPFETSDNSGKMGSKKETPYTSVEAWALTDCACLRDAIAFVASHRVANFSTIHNSSYWHFPKARGHLLFLLCPSASLLKDL